MKIIDAHLHFEPGNKYFDQIAIDAGHKNTEDHIREEYKRLGISCGIVMGNRGVEFDHYNYPELFQYCVGLDSHYLDDKTMDAAAEQIERHLQTKNCVGIKLYPGYSPIYVTDKIFEPLYDLAEKYNKPVAIHTGATSSANALLKYSHPLTLDEVAVSHPYVQFVMCHFGNPWLADAAAVLSKNSNVAADVSGLLEGRVQLDLLFQNHKEYIDALRAWLGYFNYRNIMFGTDWPLVNLEEYRDFIAHLVPEKYLEDVFYQNAVKIYQLEQFQ